MKRFIRIPLMVASLSMAVVPLTVGATAFAQGPQQGHAQHGQQHRGQRGAHAGHQGRGHRGGGGLLEESLQKLQLRPEQRNQIEAAKTALGPSREVTKQARKDLALELANEVQAGNVNKATLQPKIDAVANAEQAERAQERAALEQLHGILDAGQRAELVNDIQARHADREKRMEEWKANHPNANPQQGRAMGGERAANHLARELGLSDGQKQQVAQILQSEMPAPDPNARAQAKQREEKMLDTFKGDSFSMDQVGPNDARNKAEEHLGRAVDTAQNITRVLTAEQRTTAANKLRQRAEHGGGGMMF